jgi:multisubunit Na+/H+ antiporter MnhG subunit
VSFEAYASVAIKGAAAAAFSLLAPIAGRMLRRAAYRAGYAIARAWHHWNAAVRLLRGGRAVRIEVRRRRD